MSEFESDHESDSLKNPNQSTSSSEEENLSGNESDDEIIVKDYELEKFQSKFQKGDSWFYKIFRSFGDAESTSPSEEPKIILDNSNLFYKNSNTNLTNESKAHSSCPNREFTIPKIKENFFSSNLDAKTFNLFSTYKDILNLNNYDSQNSRKIFSAFVLNHCYNWQKIVKNNDVILNKYRLARMDLMKLEKLKEKQETTENEPPAAKKAKKAKINKNKATLGLDIDTSYSNEMLKEKFPELPNMPSENELRDQGITKPKVLILAPFKQNALEIVANFQDFLKYKPSPSSDSYKSYHFHNKAKFQIDYEIDQDTETPYSKGNLNDNFILGIQLRNKSIKLYSSFYQSDIIIASPLALKKVLSNKNDEDNVKNAKKYDFDFLSSIQICVVDSVEHIYMQNLEFLIHVLNHLNEKPKELRDVNINRIYGFQVASKENNSDGDSDPFLNTKSKRQLIFNSSISNPIITSIFNKFSTSSRGQVIVKRTDNSKHLNNNKFGVLSKINSELSRKILESDHGNGKISGDSLVYMFKRLKNEPNTSESDERLLNFHKHILKDIRALKQSNVLIFIPDYYDYVRIKKLMADRLENDPGDTFTELTEYDSITKQKLARKSFALGESKILLLTERSYYYFKRLPPNKTIKRLVFYGLPNFEEYFYEICSKIEVDEDSFVNCCFSRKEFDQLSGIVGKKKAVEMVGSKKKDVWFFSSAE